MLYNFAAPTEASTVHYLQQSRNRCIITQEQVHLRRLGILVGS